MKKSIVLGLILIIIVGLSGCELFVEQPTTSDLVCIPKEKARELNLIDDEGEPEGEMGNESEEKETEESTSMEVPAKVVVVDENETMSEEVEVVEKPKKEKKPVAEEEPKSDVPTKEFTEGDLVSIKPQATDEDGDQVSFTFSAPLDENGEWQTSAGDAGEYLVTITASDGKSEVEQKLNIIIITGNKPPQITSMASFEISIGDTVTLEPKITDPEGDEITITYSGWMNLATYTTISGDEGNHVVTISATDGISTVTEDVVINVVKVNHPPVMEELSPIAVTEGDTVVVIPIASDEDGDTLTFSFGDPLDDKGEWQTQAGNAGTYLATITVSDGEFEDSTISTITVKAANNAPVIVQDDISESMQSGDTKTITLNPTITDADGDDVTVSYSGWMDSATKILSDVTKDDEGEFEVTITASDGIEESSKTITVTIDVNTPPVFTI